MNKVGREGGEEGEKGGGGEEGIGKIVKVFCLNEGVKY